MTGRSATIRDMDDRAWRGYPNPVLRLRGLRLRLRLSARALLAILIGIVVGVASGAHVLEADAAFPTVRQAAHRSPLLAWVTAEDGDDEEQVAAELPDPAEEDGIETGDADEPAARGPSHLVGLARVPARLVIRGAPPTPLLRARPLDRSLTARGPPISLV